MYMDEMMTTYVLDATCQQMGASRHVILCLCTICLHKNSLRDEEAEEKKGGRVSLVLMIVVN